MKALLYKEFKLAMHPMCYVFVLVFPLMVLIPSYPIAVAFIYVITCYPILFLGANKGQQSNDLLFSTLLPVRKKDIVKARIATVAILQFVSMALISAFSPLGALVNANIPGSATPGLTFDGFVSVLAFAVIGFSVADFIFFPIYYKRGKSIVMSTLLMILGFVVYLSIFTIAIPCIPACSGYYAFFCQVSIGIQFIYLAVALLIYALAHYAIYRISAKLLERVDF